MENAPCLYYNGKIADVIRKRVYPGWFTIAGGTFILVEENSCTMPSYANTVDLKGKTVLPGLVDIHAHVESSFTTPRRYGEVLLRFGTTTTLVDPHEIANVLGLDGVKYMLEASERVPLNFFFSFPSCVPATTADLETTGGVLTAREFMALINHPRIRALGEQMDYRGALAGVDRIAEMSALARENNMLHEGHVPTLKGLDLSKYLSYGIHTDHTLSFPGKIKEQLTKGVCVQIQEKSITSENIECLNALPDLNNVVFVTDDIVGSKMIKGHLLSIIQKAIEFGLDPLEGLASGTIRPAKILGQRNLGLIAPGFQADFLIVDDIENLHPQEVYFKGKKVFNKKEGILYSSEPHTPEHVLNTVNIAPLRQDSFKVSTSSNQRVCRIILANQKNTLTNIKEEEVLFKNGFPLLKDHQVWVTVFERYQGGKHRGIGIVEGFALQKGAYAATVGHDSHNVIVVGKDEVSMQRAANTVIASGGGLALANEDQIIKHIALPVAGLMSDETVETIGKDMTELENYLREYGVTHEHPLLFLVMLSLSTSPYYKITDYGIVDVEGRKILSFFL